MQIENNSFSRLENFLAKKKHSSMHVLVDENTLKHCYPKIRNVLPPHQIIQIKSGERNKNIRTCEKIWQKLTDAKADRKALLLNLGGGVIGDIGGFSAGCYKRGIGFANAPTTLLAMVDASVGTKTGIDFSGLKNQIGLFNQPEEVFVYTGFLETLAKRELLSGFAEVLKHYLIADKAAFNQIAKSKSEIRSIDFSALVKKNISIKQKIVKQDPFEKNIRKSLNFGHTIGHAVESYFLSKGLKKLLHGEAVAVGMICESFISMKKRKLSEADLVAIAELVQFYFTLKPINIQTHAAINSHVAHDKKNESGETRFTLLNGIGKFSIDCSVEKDLIAESLLYFNSLCA